MPTTRQQAAAPQREPANAETRTETRTETKTERLTARLSPDEKLVLMRAAALTQQSVSQFLITTSMRAAQQVIQEHDQHDQIVLSARDSCTIMQALLNPDPAGAALRCLAQKYEAFVKRDP